MRYLKDSDYETVIESRHLAQLLNENDQSAEKAEMAAMQEMVSYIGPRYDVQAQLPAVLSFQLNKTFAMGDVVHVWAPTWQATETYQAGNLVSFGGDVFVSMTEVTGVNPDGSADWQVVGWQDCLYVCKQANTGILPNDVLYWEATDPRPQLMVMYLADISLYHLFARLAPMQVPELRKERYENALHVLQQAAAGMQVLPLAVKEAPAGQSIRWGSNRRTGHYY